MAFESPEAGATAGAERVIQDLVGTLLPGIIAGMHSVDEGSSSANGTVTVRLMLGAVTGINHRCNPPSRRWFFHGKGQTGSGSGSPCDGDQS